MHNNFLLTERKETLALSSRLSSRSQVLKKIGFLYKIEVFLSNLSLRDKIPNLDSLRQVSSPKILINQHKRSYFLNYLFRVWALTIYAPLTLNKKKWKAEISDVATLMACEVDLQ